MAEASPVRDGDKEDLSILHEATSEPTASVGIVFEQFKSYIDGRLHDLTSTLQASAQSSTSYESLQSSKKLQRETDAQKLKYKANSRQYLHNAEVEEYVTETIRLLAEDDPDTNQALTSANHALAAIQKRQKLIKLADKSEAGWMAVEEYESDELADDSDDAKRIKKAQEKAARRKKQIQLNRVKRQKTDPPVAGSQNRDKQLFRGIFFLSFFVDSGLAPSGTSQACKNVVLYCGQRHAELIRK